MNHNNTVFYTNIKKDTLMEIKHVVRGFLKVIKCICKHDDKQNL